MLGRHFSVKFISGKSRTFWLTDILLAVLMLDSFHVIFMLSFDFNYPFAASLDPTCKENLPDPKLFLRGAPHKTEPLVDFSIKSPIQPTDSDFLGSAGSLIYCCWVLHRL